MITILLSPNLATPSRRSVEKDCGDISVGSGSDIEAGATSKGGGLLKTIGKGLFTIIVMGVNAFCAAIATQVYKIFTGRWRAGGGSDIPVINTAPGGNGSAPGGSSQSLGSESSYGGGNRTVSSDFLNRYRD